MPEFHLIYDFRQPNIYPKKQNFSSDVCTGLWMASTAEAATHSA
jgi:hypothetical protein